MITIEKRLELPESYPLSRIGAPDQLLFFDMRQRDCPQNIQDSI